MSRSPVHRLAVALALVLLLAPGICRAWALDPAGPGAAEHATGLALDSWIRGLVSFLWNGLTGGNVPGASGMTTELGPEMDPDGVASDLGPEMDPNG